MDLQELPLPVAALIFAALQRDDRGALRESSRRLCAAVDACVTHATISTGRAGSRGIPAAELPRLAQRCPGLVKLTLQKGDHLQRPGLGILRCLTPALGALPSACWPAIVSVGEQPDTWRPLEPLAVVQLARICPGLTRVGLGVTPSDSAHVGAALEALAAGCPRLATLGLRVGVVTDDVDKGACLPPALSAEAVSAAAAGLRRLRGLRELSVKFCDSEATSAAARGLLPAVLPSLTALSHLDVEGESGIAIGAPWSGLKRLNVVQAAPVVSLLDTIEGPLPGVTSLCLSHDG
jgi:hypothetical protein